MQYYGVQQLDQSNISQFSKKIPFWGRAIWAQLGQKLCNLMSHDSHSEDLFEVLWCYDEAQYLDKSSLSHFSEFQKHSNMMWCNSETLIILVNFLKIFLFGLGTTWEKITQHYSHELPCGKFFEMMQGDVYNIQTKTMLVKFSKKVPFRVTHPIWGKIM